VSSLQDRIETLRLRLSLLPKPAQVAVFMTAAELLHSRWQRWAVARGVVAQQEFDECVATVRAFIEGGQLPLGSDLLLERVQSVAPSESTDTIDFTAAQDCWICLDTALRSSLDRYDAPDATWYLLEPLFQAASQTLFGVVDVGSSEQDVDEALLLQDEQVGAALRGIDEAIDLLNGESEGPIDFVVLKALMEPIAPRGETTYISHQSPLLRDRADFIVQVAVGDEVDTLEQLWVRRLSSDLLEICCVPFFLYDVSLLDVVRWDAARHSITVEKPSGRYVFRVRFSPELDQEEWVTKLVSLGAGVERSSPSMIALDAENAQVAQWLADLLAQGESTGVLEYETGRSTQSDS
jgi:hypothetical protein